MILFSFVSSRPEGKKAKKKKKNRKAKTRSISPNAVEDNEECSSDDEECNPIQDEVTQSESIPFMRKLAIDSMDPLAAIVEEVSTSTGFSCDAVTVMINVMFARGQAYDNTEAVIKELKKLVRKMSIAN